MTAISANQEVTSPVPVSFNCTVDSYPPSTITWLHNGAEVQAAPPRVTISTVQVDNKTQESTLTLLNTTAEDTGTYTCSAVNTEGMNNMTTELQVLGEGCTVDLCELVRYGGFIIIYISAGTLLTTCATVVMLNYICTVHTLVSVR